MNRFEDADGIEGPWNLMMEQAVKEDEAARKAREAVVIAELMDDLQAAIAAAEARDEKDIW